MNNILGNYTGFDGRLNRQAWWISAIILGVVGAIISWILGLILGTAGDMSRIGWQSLIVAIIIAYPYLAITIKRRHDRNNNGYDVYGFFAVQIIYDLVLATTGLGVITQVVGAIFGIYAIYILVQVGFLKGTTGPNGYGPDPLQG